MYVPILFDKGQILNPWLCSLENILDKCGHSNVWCDHESYHYNSSWIKTTINQRFEINFYKNGITIFRNRQRVLYIEFLKQILNVKATYSCYPVN